MAAALRQLHAELVPSRDYRRSLRRKARYELRVAGRGAPVRLPVRFADELRVRGQGTHRQLIWAGADIEEYAASEVACSPQRLRCHAETSFRPNVRRQLN